MMIAMFLFLLLGVGIVAVIIAAFLRLIQFMFSLPIIGALAIILLVLFLFFRI